MSNEPDYPLGAVPMAPMSAEEACVVYPERGEVQRALDVALLETGVAVIDEGMVFRDMLAAYRETMAVPEPARATPARVHKPFRLRVCLSYDGPPWLSLLAQCAWLRGGIIGESSAGDTWVGTERTPERLLRQ